MKHLIIILLASFGIVSCSSSDKLEKLHTEVMGIHDDVMPKMQNIMELKAKVAAKIEAIEGRDSTEIQNQITELRQVRRELEQADDDMMSWMRGFNREYTTLPNSEAVAYLESEKVKITAVRKSMLEAIQKASDVVGTKSE